MATGEPEWLQQGTGDAATRSWARAGQLIGGVRMLAFMVNEAPGQKRVLPGLNGPAVENTLARQEWKNRNHLGQDFSQEGMMVWTRGQW